ncbi:MAG TPA: NAD-dependent epimerase/dehydratase family protein, partial [Candidatus Saccharimonadales bacterium]|nr:NAD-dependent epimerase/dehydratase family protein [Candidatus Saccharimonadales bacterium]
MSNFWKNKKILVTGGRGFVGSHVVDFLVQNRGVKLSQIRIPKSKTHDLRNFENAKRVMKSVDIVLHLAADVGGIGYSSSHPASQMRNNLLLDLHMFEAAAASKVKKFVCVSSAVAYPVSASSPLREEHLFEGNPADGGYGYGFAKRMAAVLTRAYRQERGLD